MKQDFKELKYMNGIIMAQPVVQQERMDQEDNQKKPKKFHWTWGKKAYSRLIPYFLYRIKYVFTELGKAITSHT